MPYMIKNEGGEFCVFKKGQNGQPEGKALGKHPDEAGAKKQLAALYANMKQEGKSVLETLSAGFKGLMDLLTGNGGEAEPKDEADEPTTDVEDTEEKPKKKDAKPEKKEFELGFKIVGNHWRAAWTNNFEDRSRQLFSLKSIDNYINEVSTHPEEMPELWAWHKPAPIGKAETIARIGHIVVAAGKFYNDKPYVQEFIQNQPKRAEKDGMSHGYWYYKDQLDKSGVYHQFKTFEITVLPLEVAANPYTNFAVKEGENKEMLTEAQKAYFKEIFGAEADNFIADAEKKSKELEAKGIRYKEDDSAFQELATQVKTLVESVATLTKENADMKKTVEDGFKATGEKSGLIESFLKFEFNKKDLASKSEDTKADPEKDRALKDLADKNKEQEEANKGEKDLTYVFMPFLKPQS